MTTATKVAAAPTVTPAPPGPRRGRLLRWLPLAPATAMLLLFLGGPIVYCVYIAFTDMQLTGASTTDFVGLDNFRRAFGDEDFRNAVVLTLVFTLLSSLVGQNTLGLGLAALMQRASAPVRTLTGSIVIAAWVVPEIVAGFLLYAFFRREGTLNALLDWLGLPSQNWLYTLPILAVSFANVWRGTAFSMLIYSAALSEIPKEITEAAQVDGAGGLRRFWHITLPMIRRSIGTNLMLNTLQTLSVFGLIWAMTRGGPGNRSQTLPVFMYDQAFNKSLIGYGTAVALLLLLVGALFSVVYLRLMREEV
ncbi:MULTISPECIES: carbohydrate ABC transporter permease [Streptomyces]|uniref:Multiple sugar transport system permease protein n=2 Tax=Streptomyces TaxID=1883 RepID=A0ABT9KZ49_9ACTN|nr:MULTISPECIES: sugar ABC transporter permease [Streptomyces]MBW8094036.1 sugar ABC transporter permease [Streptomyces hygroscopicus subsp. hygroscopicus]MDN3053800.1 sugar ABC transporter permease [Streptomyces sp. SRF1]MDP9613639.1 multiple sugar transport system permease protein [Streptomyces demainii]GLV77451.1 amino acid ABC transporter permease [Streptomyces hygroscopicus subsp. hygroscopicus]